MAELALGPVATVVEVTRQDTVTIILMEVPAVLAGIMDRGQDPDPLWD